MRTIGVLGIIALAACGGSDAGISPDGGRPDGGGASDAPGCSVFIMLTPSNPVAPKIIRAQAVLTGVGGFPTLTWQVTGPGNVLIPTTSTGQLEITFEADAAGPYTVSLSVSGGGPSCHPVTNHIDVMAPNANTAMYRLRLTPPADVAPPQADHTVLVVGGSDFPLPGTLALTPGTQLVGHLTGPGGPLAAYLRLDADRPTFAELFADVTGAYSGFLPVRAYNVLVVPFASDVAPKSLAVTFNQLATGLTLDAGDAVSGVAHDGAGQPLAGARIAIAAGALPPLLTDTASDGSFAARVRAASGPLSLTVVPASGALHLELSAAAAVNVSGGSSITATLPEIATTSFTPLAVRSNGAALPGAVVTFVDGGGLPAGIVDVDGTGHAAVAAVRASFVADASGALPSITLPVGSYHVVVDPGATTGQALGRLDVDLDAPPATLAAAAPAPTQVIVRHGSQPIVGAQAFAIAAGAGGVGAGVTVAATTDASGTATLGLAPGCSYAVLVDAGAQPLALGRGATTGGASAVTITLASAIHVTGNVVNPSGTAQAGVRVEALCGVCTGPDADVPLDAAITDVGGNFTLRVPDPGVGP